MFKDTDRFAYWLMVLPGLLHFTRFGYRAARRHWNPVSAYLRDRHVLITGATSGLGLATAEVCRRHGISSATFYKWKSKFGGLEVSEARRLRSLEEENSRQKKLLAEAMLDNPVLKDLA